MKAKTSMKVLYTARELFENSNKEKDINFTGISNCFAVGRNPWESYISWSRLYHLRELISLDILLNRNIPDVVDSCKSAYWDYIVSENNIIHDELFTTLDYVLRMTKGKEKFHLLAVVKGPTEDCKGIRLDGFDFVGYELLESFSGISALTNCGGFDETFLPSELNYYGLVEDFRRAYDIQRKLIENNPDEPHAATSVYGLWRHKRIGRWRRYR